MQAHVIKFRKTKIFVYRSLACHKSPLVYFSNENSEKASHQHKATPIAAQSKKDRIIQNIKIFHFMKKYFIPIGNPTSKLNPIS